MGHCMRFFFLQQTQFLKQTSERTTERVLVLRQLRQLLASVLLLQSRANQKREQWLFCCEIISSFQTNFIIDLRNGRPK